MPPAKVQVAPVAAAVAASRVTSARVAVFVMTAIVGVLETSLTCGEKRRALMRVLIPNATVSDVVKHQQQRHKE